MTDSADDQAQDSDSYGSRGRGDLDALPSQWRLRQTAGLEHTIDVSVGLWPDNETMAADIWYDNAHFAEISEAEPEPIIEIFPRADGGSWVFTTHELASLLGRVRQRLEQLKKTEP